MTSLVTFVYIQSVISMHCFTALISLTMASGGDGNFPEYQVKCYILESASDSAESFSNSAHSEQFNDASRLR